MTAIRRFGVLAPPGNVALEQELPSLLPAGIFMHHNRLSRPGAAISADSLLAMADSIERAAHDVAQAYPEVILYGCTSGSFLAGMGRESEIADRITKLTGIKAITTSTAVIAALRSVSAQKVFMLTPYPRDITEHEVEFLAHYGIETVGFDTFECPTSEAIRAVSADDVAARVLSHRDSILAADAVFISCTNLLSIAQIAAMEAALGKPVISSNQASLWSVLKLMDVSTSGMNAGSLFKFPMTSDGLPDSGQKRKVA
jgi:maleate isomerase